MIVPAPKVVRSLSEFVILVSVNALIVESFRNWIAPNLPGVAPAAESMIVEPADENSRALFRELAIVVLYQIG
jgi:hypothetical protein